MLTTNLPLMKQKLNQLISTPPAGESPVYKAAYDAYYNSVKVDIDGNNNDPDLGPIVAEKKAECEQKMKDDAKKFATNFCEGLKNNGFMDSIADEIDGHIKSMKLMISVLPTGIATIVSTAPGAPCTGALIIDDPTTATISIL
jgi:hypothetical protein